MRGPAGCPRWLLPLAWASSALLGASPASAHGPIDCGQAGGALLGGIFLYVLFPLAGILMLVRGRTSSLIFGCGLIVLGGQDATAWWDDPHKPLLSVGTALALLGLVASLVVEWRRSRAEEDLAAAAAVPAPPPAPAGPPPPDREQPGPRPP